VFRKSLDEASERLYDIERGHKEVASDFSLGESLVLFLHMDVQRKKVSKLMGAQRSEQGKNSLARFMQSGA
jgi:hypothetical protein